MPYKSREKHLEWHRQRHARLKEYLVNLKESNPCTDCKTYYPHYIMDFDHVRGIKVKNISHFGNRVWEIKLWKKN